jgi:hypothetical protein
LVAILPSFYAHRMTLDPQSPIRPSRYFRKAHPIRIHDNRLRQTRVHHPGSSPPFSSTSLLPEIVECRYRPASFAVTPTGQACRSSHPSVLVRKNIFLLQKEDSGCDQTISSNPPCGLIRVLPIDIVLISNVSKEPDLALGNEHGNAQGMNGSIPKSLVVKPSTTV